MISFFSTSASHYLTDICPNDRYNTHTLEHNTTITHCSSGTLYLPQTTVHNKWTFSQYWPFFVCFCAKPPHVCFWFGSKDANGHLVNWISSQDGDKGRGVDFLFLFSDSASYFEPCSVQWCVETALMRRVEKSPPLLDSFKSLCPPDHFHVMRGGKPHWPRM